MGCRKGAAPEAIRALALAVLEQAGVPLQAVEAVCTIDRKRNEPGLLAFCGALGLPLTTYSAGELAQAPGTFTPSPFVEEVTGVDNVCERAALAAGGVLLRKKTALNGVTLALAGREPRLTWNTDGRILP